MRHAVKNNNNIAYGEVLILLVVIEAEGKTNFSLCVALSKQL